MLTAIVAGRSLGWISNGRPGSDVPEMTIELGVIAALVALSRGAANTATAASHTRPNRPGDRRRAVVAVALFVIPAVGAAAVLSPGVQQRIFDAGAERLASTINMSPLEDDALRVAVCGSSAPLASAPRAKACVAVFAGEGSTSWTPVPSRSRT